MKTMKKRPTIRVGKHLVEDRLVWSGDPNKVGIGTYSLLPDGRWFLFDGVAFQADRCAACDGTGAQLTVGNRRSKVNCEACHGLGLVPRVGRIERVRLLSGDLRLVAPLRRAQ